MKANSAIGSKQPTRKASRRVAWTAAGLAAAVVVSVAACSSSGGKPASTNSARPGSTSCAGSPLKFMTIFSLTGKLATTGNAVSDAAAAAVKSANSSCAAGRPIQVTVCDDQSTPNGSLQCGEKARSNGTLAIVGFTAGPGGSDQGAQTANLPGLFTADITSWDNTSKQSYPDYFPNA